jgi:very-short-patch-repair endonuclease
MQIVDTKVLIEVDGPMHYVQELGRASVLSGGQAHWNGSTSLKHHLLTQLGFSVVHVPYFEWQKHVGTARTDYLRSLLVPFKLKT